MRPRARPSHASCAPMLQRLVVMITGHELQRCASRACCLAPPCVLPGRPRARISHTTYPLKVNAPFGWLGRRACGKVVGVVAWTPHVGLPDWQAGFLLAPSLASTLLTLWVVSIALLSIICNCCCRSAVLARKLTLSERNLCRASEQPLRAQPGTGSGKLRPMQSSKAFQAESQHKQSVLRWAAACTDSDKGCVRWP